MDLLCVIQKITPLKGLFDCEKHLKSNSPNVDFQIQLGEENIEDDETNVDEKKVFKEPKYSATIKLKEPMLGKDRAICDENGKELIALESLGDSKSLSVIIESPALNFLFKCMNDGLEPIVDTGKGIHECKENPIECVSGAYDSFAELITSLKEIDKLIVELEEFIFTVLPNLDSNAVRQIVCSMVAETILDIAVTAGTGGAGLGKFIASLTKKLKTLIKIVKAKGIILSEKVLRKLSKLKTADLENIEEIQSIAKKRELKMQELNLKGEPIKDANKELNNILNSCKPSVGKK